MLISNTEHWNILESKGILFDYLKDGYPQGLFNKVFAMAYPIMIAVIIVVAILLVVTLPREKRKLKSMFFGVGFGSIVGWIWGAWMLHADSSFPGWLFPIYAVTNIEWILPLEDWLFYPACTLLFYGIFRRVDFSSRSWDKPVLYWGLVLFYCAFIVFYGFCTALCGRVGAFMFALPGLFFFVVAYKSGNVVLKDFLLFQIVLISINCLWDWTAVSWIHGIPGKAWASRWLYVSFDSVGNHYQSSVFLDFVKQPWGWIFNNPIEGTPMMGIAGGLLNYSMFAVADTWFYPESDDQI